LNIKLAWNFDIYAYQSLFPEITLFNWDKDRNEQIDLMVFPGGEDVSLEYYTSGDSIRRFSNLCYTNRERDDYEVNILDACYDGRLNVNKILGVCRGMQLINVMFSGRLFEDLYSYEMAHDKIHDIKHKIPNVFSSVRKVNSMHHQGIRTLGSYNRRGNNVYPKILASDGKGRIPEIVMWEGGRVLGVQFHPEYFWNDNPDKTLFREEFYKWVRGESNILKGDE